MPFPPTQSLISKTNPPPTADPGADPGAVEISEERVDQVLLQIEKLFVRGRVDKEKIYLYAQARLMEHYYHGRHQLVPKTNTRGEIVDFAPVTTNALSLVSSTQSDEDDELNQWIINDFRADVNKFIAVLGTKAPNMIGRPRWATDPEGISRARIGTEAAYALQSEWRLNERMPQLARGLAIQGPIFIHTPFVINQSRLGTSKVEVLTEVPTKLEDDYFECRMCGGVSPVTVTNCVECGNELGESEKVEGEVMNLPQSGGEVEYPNGEVELNFYSALEVTTPFHVEGLKQTPWLVMDRDKDPAWVMENLDPEGKKLGEEFKSGTLSQGDSDSTQQRGQQARELDANPFGTGQNTLWTVSEVYLRPMMYHYVRRVSGENGAEESDSIVKWLKERFPKGLRYVRVGTHVLSKSNVLLDNEWAVARSGTGKYLWDDPYFADYIQLQDMMNDAWSLEVALRMRAFSVTYFDPQRLHPDSVNKRILPGEHVPMVGTGVGNISDAFYKSTPTDIEPSSHEYIMTLRDIARELVGLFPAVFGVQAADETAEGSRRRLNQALMVLAVVWNNIREGLTTATYNAVMQLARYGGNKFVSSSGDSDSVSIKELPKLSEVLKGGWWLESDQAIPMNWSQLKDFVQSLQSSTPEYQSALGMNSPSNMDLINQGIGVPGWKIPGLEARNKLLTVFRMLLDSEPIPNGPDPQSGEPSYSSSVPYDSLVYDPQLVIDTVREWLYNDSNAEYEGTPGYDNLLYYARAAKAELDALSAPPMEGEQPPPPPAPPLPPPAPPPDPAAQLETTASPLIAEDQASMDQLEDLPEILPPQNDLTALSM